MNNSDCENSKKAQKPSSTGTRVPRRTVFVPKFDRKKTPIEKPIDHLVYNITLFGRKQYVLGQRQPHAKFTMATWTSSSGDILPAAVSYTII